ncbi:signal peptidase I [Chamaesiphon polymorphus]|uniref:Signal peptidase I n=1 Tax=Chamaesiphon polymorphus CCALA 037 TaxID=2107692 RepID=A0A2T1GAV2_9CYAN|nr:signal peptidase I [Chamaesiphon polymorphus]PSB54354.1 signal peptidase I [Chamaesiphon polymorphus CCALA 037]
MDYEQPKSEPESTSDANVAPPKAENPWMETLKTIGLSAVLAFGIRSFVAEARYIPSGSMLPTLHIDDRLIIDKISYRFSDPARGDIVVFNPTAKLEEEKFKDAFIKRVIGVPGDRVDIKSGKVYINGKFLSENYLGEDPNYNWSSTTLTPDGIVPKGHYLVLGDNRDNSYDSRFWGFVPKDKIVGKATVRFWPINRAGGIDPQPEYTK